MKKYYLPEAILSLLLTVTIPIWSMDSDWMTQSTIDPESIIITEQKTKKSKTLPSISLHEKKINSLRNNIKRIDQSKQEKYKSIINPILLTLKTPKKLTTNKLTSIDYTIKIINGETAQDIIQNLNQQVLNVRNKLSILTDLYNLPQPKIYQELKSSLYKKPQQSRDQKVIQNEQRELTSWLTTKADIKTEINKLELEYSNKIVSMKAKLQKEDTPATVLREYKTVLEKSITQLKNTQDPDKIAQRDKYQVTLAIISEQIPLFTEIDTQLLIDYNNFSIKQLLDYIESLTELRKLLNNFTSERYKELNTKIQTATVDLRLKQQQRDEQDRLAVQQRLEKQQTIETAQIKIAQEEQQKIDKEIQQMQLNETDKSIQLEEEKYEQEKKARQEQAKMTAAQEEQRKTEALQKLAQELKEEESKKWMPSWLTNQFTTLQHSISNFFSYVRSWWPF